MNIPLYSPTIYRNEMEAVLTRMVEEEVGPGESNKELASKVSQYLDNAYSVAFRSPSVALSYALSCLKIPSDSSVLISALAPYWMYVELKKHNITPVIVDTYHDDVFMDVSRVKAEIEGGAEDESRVKRSNVKAIILCEPLGFMPEMQELLDLGIPIIEDISQSIGASRAGRKAGTFGDFAILGLEEHDLLTGGGGALLIANKKEMQASLKELSASFFSIELMPDMNASLALIQLRQMSKNTTIKLEFLQTYQRSLLQTRHKSFQLSEDSINPVYSFPVIFNSNINDIETFVEKKGIEIKKAFATSIIANKKDLQEECVNATSIFLRTYIFPLYPRLGKRQAIEIAKILAVLP